MLNLMEGGLGVMEDWTPAPEHRTPWCITCLFLLCSMFFFSPFRRVFGSIFCKIARITISQAQSSVFSYLYKHWWSFTAHFCDPPMTASTVPSEKLEREAISVYFLKIPPEPVERKLETETDFCVLGEKHILYAFQSPRGLAAKPGLAPHTCSYGFTRRSL